MGIRVEFYGVPRLRAGVASLEIPLSAESIKLGEALHDIAGRFAGLATEIGEDGLQPTCVANINGNRFVSDTAEPLRDGDVLLIMSADAGG
jgi:molybdopterin converting factor small subunit